MWKIFREGSEQAVATVKPDRAGRFRVQVHVEDDRLRETLAARPRQFVMLVGQEEFIDGERAHVMVKRKVTFKASPDGYMLELDTWLLERGFRAVWTTSGARSQFSPWLLRQAWRRVRGRLRPPHC